MKQITCEICGGKNIIKRDGAYVCADCGIKYTADEIKKLLSNTPDDVPACSEMPLENSESTPSNSSAASEIPDKINHKSKIPLLALAACVCVALLVVAVELIIPNVRYNNAVSLMNDGKYEDAIAAFEALDGYKDSTDKIDECNLDVLKKVQIGDSIEFGTYEQDNDTTNGKESIEWYVLDKEDNRLLVISKYALDGMPYNTTNEDVTWQTCTLRTWLNETFFKEAFSKPERSIIQTTGVTADNNPDYCTNPGNDTNDKIFLLSIAEANKYFASSRASACAPTEYANANGAWTSDTYGFAHMIFEVDGAVTCWWWLRSPGGDQNTAARVFFNCGVDCDGYLVTNNLGCVRPAMWIDLSA